MAEEIRDADGSITGWVSQDRESGAWVFQEPSPTGPVETARRTNRDEIDAIVAWRSSRALRKELNRPPEQPPEAAPPGHVHDNRSVDLRSLRDRLRGS